MERSFESVLSDSPFYFISRVDYDIAFYGVIFWTIVFVGWICLFQFGYKSIPWLNYFHLVYPDGLGWA